MSHASTSKYDPFLYTDRRTLFPKEPIARRINIRGKPLTVPYPDGKPGRSVHSTDYSNLTQPFPSSGMADGLCTRCFKSTTASYTDLTHSNGQCPLQSIPDMSTRPMSIESFDSRTNSTTVYLDDTAPFAVPQAPSVPVSLPVLPLSNASAARLVMKAIPLYSKASLFSIFFFDGFLRDYIQSTTVNSAFGVKLRKMKELLDELNEVLEEAEQNYLTDSDSDSE